MPVKHHYTTLEKEADRITLLLIKNRRTDKDMFTLIEEFMDPKFKEDAVTIKSLIPTFLARHFYYEIQSIDPFRIRSFKIKTSRY